MFSVLRFKLSAGKNQHLKRPTDNLSHFSTSLLDCVSRKKPASNTRAATPVVINIFLLIFKLLGKFSKITHFCTKTMPAFAHLHSFKVNFSIYCGFGKCHNQHADYGEQSANELVCQRQCSKEKISANQHKNSF